MVPHFSSIADEKGLAEPICFDKPLTTVAIQLEMPFLRPRLPSKLGRRKGRARPLEEYSAVRNLGFNCEQLLNSPKSID